MLKTGVTLIALIALPVLGRPGDHDNGIEKKPRGLNRRDGFDEWFWQIDTPTPSEFDVSDFQSNAQMLLLLEIRDVWKGERWMKLTIYSLTPLYSMDVLATMAGSHFLPILELKISLTKVLRTVTGSWDPYPISRIHDLISNRLTNDSSSAIIWELSSTLSFGDQIVHPFWNDTDDLPIVLDFNGILGESFTNTTSTFDQSGADPWDSTTSTTAILIRSVTVQNSECNESIDITLTTIDALGNEQVFIAVDDLTVNVPSALPANVSFVGVGQSTGEISGMTLVFLNLEPVSYVLGNGPNG